jgi:hypothetical protein
MSQRRKEKILTKNKHKDQTKVVNYKLYSLNKRDTIQRVRKRFCILPQTIIPDSSPQNFLCTWERDTNRLDEKQNHLGN